MKVTQKRELTGEWVGFIEQGDRREFVRISFDEGWCDLPERRHFNLEIRRDAGADTFHIGDVFSFSGWAAGGRISARREGGGAIELWRVVDAAPNPNRSIGGYYQLPKGEMLHIFSQTLADDSSWQSYSRRGSRWERLYRLESSLYVSEVGAFYKFDGSGLTVKHFGGEDVSASKLQVYQREQVIVPTQQGHILAGSLLTPMSDGPHPVVILVHGAGPGYQDDYLAYASFFLEQGIAAIIYDKQGWGGSGGEEVWSDVLKLADDTEAVIRFLKSHSSVQPERIGLCGFSNGGWVAPLAASRFEDIAFIICFSGSGVSPARQETVRRCWVARDVLGASEEGAALLEEFWGHAFEFLATGEWSEEFERILYKVDHDPELQALPKHAGMPDGSQPVPPLRTREEWDDIGAGSADMLFDPVPVFTSLSCPLLFVWGEQDSLVPVEESAQAVATILDERQDCAVLRFPQAGHQLFTIDPGITYAHPLGDEIARFRRVPRRYVDGLWEGILSWVQEHS